MVKEVRNRIVIWWKKLDSIKRFEGGSLEDGSKAVKSRSRTEEIKRKGKRK